MPSLILPRERVESGIKTTQTDKLQWYLVHNNVQTVYTITNEHLGTLVKNISSLAKLFVNLGHKWYKQFSGCYIRNFRAIDCLWEL